ncbi:MAG TPA: right-handed parallel beta-helix repeat-containing protein [Rhizobiaceae bacterium]|nr:right-handed parallel beta-helix repeat-containing protein [Rhizobiaceae bacterium]
MTVFTKLGNDIFSPVDSAGNPRKVENHDAQVWATEVERLFAAFQAGGGIVFTTKAGADASLNYPANSMAWVIGDPVEANNGIYRKVGASGSGSWVRVGDLPYSFIRATNTGTGTANAIQATTSVPIPIADGGALISLNIVATNTADAPTVSFNGGTPLTITDAAGSPVTAEGLADGMLINGYKVGSTFRVDLGPRGWSPLLRIVTDGARRVVELYDWTGGHGAKPDLTGYLGATGIVSGIAQATDIRGPAGPNGPGTGDMLKSVYDPGSVEGNAFNGFPVEDRTELKALDISFFTAAYLKEPGREGQFIWRTGDYLARISADPQEGVYVKADSIAATAGAWVRQFSGPASINWFGASPSASAAANTATINACLAVSDAVLIPPGTYSINGTLNISRRGQRVVGVGLRSIIRQTANNTDAIVLQNGVSAEVRLEHFMVSGVGATFTTGGVGVRSEYAGNLLFHDITVSSMFRGFYVDTRTFVATSDVYLSRCVAYDCTEVGFEVNNCTGLYLYESSALSCGGTGVRITDGSAVHLRNVLSLLNDAHGLQVRTVNNAASNWHFFDQVECDGNGADGFNLNNTGGLQASNCWSGTNDGTGWSFVSGNKDFMGSNCSSRNNGNHGWGMSGLTGGQLANCSGRDNGRLTAGASGFFFATGATDTILSNCDASDTLASHRQGIGFNIAGSSAGIQINGGKALNNVTAQVANSSSGANNRVRNIRGHRTKASGSGTMPTGGSVPVTHGLAAAPTRVIITPTQDPQVRYFVSSKGAATFTVNCNTAPASGWTFDWEAFVGDE